MWKNIIFVILLYLLAYNPLFSFMGGLGSIKLLYPLLLLYFLTCWKSFPKLLKRYKTESYFFLSFIAYTVVRTLLGGEAIEIYTHAVFFIETFFLPVLLLLISIRYSLVSSREDILIIILWVGCVASVISVACIVNPSIQDFVKFRLQYISVSDFLFDTDYRGFGLCDSLTFSYGIIQGMILGIGILNISRFKWFIYFIPFFIASIILNARTGIFIPIVAVFIYIFANKGSAKKILYIAVGGIVTYALIVFLLRSYSLNDDQMYFVEDFTQQLTDARDSGGETGTIGALTRKHTVLPSDFGEWLIGKGYIITGRKGERNSDSGFFQQLNYGGLFYMFLMFGFIWYIYRRSIRYKVPKAYILFFLATIAISHFKGNFIMNSGGFKLIMLLYYFFLYYSPLSINSIRHYQIKR